MKNKIFNVKLSIIEKKNYGQTNFLVILLKKLGNENNLVKLIIMIN